MYVDMQMHGGISAFRKKEEKSNSYKCGNIHHPYSTPFTLWYCPSR